MLGRDGRPGDHLDLGVVEHLSFAGRNLHFREPVRKAGQLGRVGVVDPFELAAGFRQPVAHPVDVPVVEPNSCEDELALFTGRYGPAFWGIVHTVSGGHSQNSSQAGAVGPPSCLVADLGKSVLVLTWPLVPRGSA